MDARLPVTVPSAYATGEKLDRLVTGESGVALRLLRSPPLGAYRRIVTVA